MSVSFSIDLAQSDADEGLVVAIRIVVIGSAARL